MIRVAVSADLCQGHGRCYALAPEVYAPDPEGYNAARGTTLQISDEHEARARRGAKGCPEKAIEVLEDEHDTTTAPRR